jgi:DNA-binding winged helix-turn-helix (wHTH) protein
VLTQKSDLIVSRDEIAQAVWGEKWITKYSDWQIDRLIYLVRKKLSAKFCIKTIRNRGYLLSKSGMVIAKDLPMSVEGTLPSQSYLEYMNNPKNPRKVLKDLFKSIKLSKKFKNILVINSYSYDNVDTMAKYFSISHVYFSNFDKRALSLHQERINQLKLDTFKTTEDDIRESIFKDCYFDLIINDFRLNFNTTNLQNEMTIKSMYRLLNVGGQAIVSVVIDPRRNPNRDQPYTFSAQEGLTRFCFTSAYYQHLFIKNKFKITSEFDIKNGQKWNLPYRRFLLQK